MSATKTTTAKTGSVHHVVLFRLKPTIDMAKVKALVDGCVRAVPGLIELHFGAEEPKIFDTKVDRANGVTHVLVSRHVNPEALKVYATHPEHVKLAKYLMSFATGAPIAADTFSYSKL